MRNTDYVIGIVVNTGRDSKVMQGQQAPKVKSSSLDAGINYLMVGIMALQLFLCMISTIVSEMWHDSLESSWYVHESAGEALPAPFILTGVLQFFVLLAAFVSVSLYVSVDSNKAFMKVIMEKRKEMVHGEGAQQTRLKVRTMSLIDELGVVSHVFSDKTGTLTQNMMQFRKCSINGVSYGHGNTEIGLARLARLGQLPPSSELPAGQGGPGDTANRDVNFDGPELFAALRGDHGVEQRDRGRDFLMLLALCHTVVVEQVGSEKKLSASSPDEAALVSAASYFGVEFVNKQHSTVTLRDTFTGSQPKFEVLEVLEFSSARKRMSVVVQEPKSSREPGRIRLLSKGADSVMLPLLDPSEADVLAKTQMHLDDHANDGLRTLLLTHKTLDPRTYEEWSKRYRASLVDLAELEKKEKEQPNEIERLMSEIEIGLSLVGSTAIEDKLQAGVPKTIADMGRAGISVWVLTGDKEETAINIAFACELFDTRTKILILNHKSFPTAQDVRDEVRKHGRMAESTQYTEAKHALVVDGEVIAQVMSDAQLQLDLLKLTQHCQSVIACRCAPSQKAQLVTLVRRNVAGAITLAIGDGANDVAMIQAAHVGIGISGQEGMQAANSADFSIGQFRFLSELLFVWGRNAYRRMSTMIFYIFYKNTLLVLITYWYVFYSAASRTRIYIELGLQFYNVIWTAVPIIVCTIFDRDVSDDLSRRLPQLYHLGIRRAYFNVGTVLRWLGDAIVESLIVFFALILATPSMVTPLGGARDPGHAYLGDYAFAIILVIVTAKLALCQYQVTWQQHCSMLFCLIIWWPLSWVGNKSMWVGGYVGGFLVDYVGLFEMVQGNPAYWLLVVLVPATVLLPMLYLEVYKRTFYPELRDLAMESEFWGLEQEHLCDWQIPLKQRRLPLRKDAPRPLQAQSALGRWLSGGSSQPKRAKHRGPQRA